MALTHDEQRDQIDVELSRALEIVLGEQQSKLNQELGVPPEVDHPTDEYWHALERQILNELMPSLEEAYRISALHESRIWHYDLDLEEIGFEARLWAVKISEPVAREFVANTKERLSAGLIAAAAIAAAHATDEESRHRILDMLLEEEEERGRHAREQEHIRAEHEGAAAAARRARPAPATNGKPITYSEKMRRQVDEQLNEEADRIYEEESARAISTLYSEGRAGAVAVTAVTKATTDGQQVTISLIERDTGAQLKGFWKAQDGACDVCRPLDGKGPEVWAPLFPGGPPGPHPHCKCKLVYQMVYELQGAR